jgi:peroxiredoxin
MTKLTLSLAAAALTATALAGPGHSHAKLGEAVPDFELVDSTGKTHKLSDYKGKIIVLEWINRECPWVVKAYKASACQDAVKKSRQIDENVVWLAINSTNWTKPDENNHWIKMYGLEYPILLDNDGEVGHMFDARRTPHMFVIDQKGVLRYDGALDNDKMRDTPESDQINYVVNAIDQITKGDPVAPDQVKPYGCSVKYKQ